MTKLKSSVCRLELNHCDHNKTDINNNYSNYWYYVIEVENIIPKYI